MPLKEGSQIAVTALPDTNQTAFSTRTLLGSTLPPGTQRVGPLAEIPKLLRELGTKPSRVLRQAGMPPDALLDPEARIPYRAAGKLLQFCVDATGRTDFPLFLAERWRLSQIGPVGEVMACSATLKHALQCFAAFQWFNASGGCVFLKTQDRLTSFGYAIYEPGMTEGVPYVSDLTMGIGRQFIRELTGLPDWTPALVQFSRPTPENLEPYIRFFGENIQFNAPASQVFFPSSLTATILPTRNDARWRELLNAMTQRREDLLRQMHRMVRVGLQLELSANELAGSLFISRRTLDRRLRALGTTYREIEQHVRFDVATQLLRDTTLSVAEIAQALRYAEASVFVRAFQRWSGTTPEKWRKANAGLSRVRKQPYRPG